MKLSGWGRFPIADCRVEAPRDFSEVAILAKGGSLIARGNGRAYGDAALNQGLTLDMRRLSRMLAFDEAGGILAAEAGVMLDEVIKVFLPRGWFPSITPGTRFVTLGGMAASDVHGKNHHRDGSFRNAVAWLDLLGQDGKERRISAESHPQLFDMTLGGMGLSGIILRLAIRLRQVETGWIRQKTIDAPDLDAAMEAFEVNHSAHYSVAWIDCLAGGKSLGRSLLMVGEHARLEDLPSNLRGSPLVGARRRRRRIPFDLPVGAMNRWTIRSFNAFYYHYHRRRTHALVSWEDYFYPLDSLHEWNRVYGRKGFLQFQCVLPLDRARDGLKVLLERIAAAGKGSFLAVLKRLGPQQSALSFPMEGYTLALDFPATPDCLELMRTLVPIVSDHGGRFYLAKDAILTAEDLRHCDTRVEIFRQIREADGTEAAFSSLLSRRLEL